MSLAITSKQATFDVFANRFMNCSSPGEKNIWTRIIDRQGNVPAIVNLHYQRNSVEVETIDRTVHGGMDEQFILETNQEARGSVQFNNWLTVARAAGDELSRTLLVSHLQGRKDGVSDFPRGACGWLLAIGRMYEAGELALPVKAGYVDQEAWLQACDAKNRAENPSEPEKGKKQAEFEGLWEKTLEAGKEYVCEDTITASALMAKWLSQNDWPFDRVNFVQVTTETQPTPGTNHLTDPLWIELGLAIHDIEDYSPGRPWYFLDCWNIPFRWAKLIEQAKKSGLGEIIRDDGTTVSIHHRATGLDAAYIRRTNSNDGMVGQRWLSVLKAMLAHREAELREAARPQIVENSNEKQRVAPVIDSEPVVESIQIQPIPTKPIDRAKQDRNDWLLAQRGTDNVPKMNEADLSKALAVACETYVDWVHIEPRSIASALREAYSRKTGNKWPFDGRGRKKSNPKASPKNTRKR